MIIKNKSNVQFNEHGFDKYKKTRGVPVYQNKWACTDKEKATLVQKEEKGFVWFARC